MAQTNELPRNYRGKYPNSVSASFDWTDVAAGLGYNNFYLVFGVGSERLLSPRNFVSMGGTFINTGQTDVKITSSTFKLPQRVGGDAYLSLYLWTAASTGNRTLTITIQKYNGSTYTNISAATSLVASVTSTTNTLWTAKIACNPTTIKKGERLVLNVTTDNSLVVVANTTATPAFIAIPQEIRL